MTLRWHKQTDCPDVPGCDCPEPSSPPSYVGQTVNTDCGGSSGSSSSGAVPSGSSGSSPSGNCVCSGTCTCTAELSNVLVYYPLVWSYPKAGCVGEDTRCGCNVPTRSPDFVGDTFVSSCSCCQGCQWYYNWAGPYWELTDVVGAACLWAECPHPCGTGPDWLPTVGWPGTPVVVAACGVNLAGGSSGGSPTSVSSSSP